MTRPAQPVFSQVPAGVFDGFRALERGVPGHARERHSPGRPSNGLYPGVRAKAAEGRRIPRRCARFRADPWQGRGLACPAYALVGRGRRVVMRLQNVKEHRPRCWPVADGGRLQSLHPDGVRIACEIGESLFSGRIEIEGVPKFCFLGNPVSGGFSTPRRTVPLMRPQPGKHWLFSTFSIAAPGRIVRRPTRFGKKVLLCGRIKKEGPIKN